LSAFGAFWLGLTVTAALARAGVPPPTFDRAEALLPSAARVLARNEAPRVHWSRDGASLAYRRETPSGDEYVRISLPAGKRAPLFDHARLAAALGEASGGRIDPTALALDESSLDLDRQSVGAEIEGARFRCQWSTYSCSAIHGTALPAATSRSPDGRFDLVREGYDLWLEDHSHGLAKQLTADGSAEHYYGASVFLERDEALGLPHEPPVVWSPDSRRAATIRLNVRGVGRTSILRTAAAAEDPRPRAISFRFPMLGDALLPKAELVLVDAAGGRVQVIASEPWPMPSQAPFGEDPGSSLGWWSEDGSSFFWLQIGRGNHTISLWHADAETGEARKLLEESSRTRVGPQQGFIDPRNTHTLADSHEILWFSERDGWGHLFLYDGRTGTLKRRLTEGPWLVREVVRMDAARRLVYFTASGRESGRNPYLRHLYRTSLDGGEVELLTPENADHTVRFSPDGRYFVDTFSRVDTAPRTVVRTAQGKLAARVETADLSALLEAGWRFPEPFVTLAADGETPIHGVLFYPRDYDPGRKYAVIDDIYPLTRVPTRLRLDA
ncbi:MAG: DPP IV N-terminal domain-containing protein, partial [Holophagales bacterium]|nr:DPP IV N-terminal domain-containing protein [Holophagales bacterium]